MENLVNSIVAALVVEAVKALWKRAIERMEARADSNANSVEK